MKPSGYILLLSMMLLADQMTAQMFGSLNYPHSIISGGMGEQGVTLANPTDAMQYNPANLARIDDLSISFYRNPWTQIGFNGAPVTSATLSYKPSNRLSFGVDYTDWDLGMLSLTTVDFPDGIGEPSHVYERSVAGAAALQLGSEWALGAELRYAVNSMLGTAKVEHLLFGAGMSYAPEALSDRMHAGFSFMNFSTPARYSATTLVPVPGSVGPQFISRSFEIKEPIDAHINLGADFAVLHEPLFDLTLSLGFSKAISKFDDTSGIVGQSSFKALFTDWKDFPEDVITHFGLGYVWKPLPLGGGVSYIQEMYLGYISMAIATGNVNYYTHGVRAGFEIMGVKAMAGYAGRWHNNNAFIFFGMDEFFTTETFQFALSADLNALRTYDAAADRSERLKQIIVSGGYSYCAHLGKWDRQEIDGSSLENKLPSLWSVESDFYLTDNSALVGSFAYGHMVESVDVLWWRGFTQHLSEDVETLSLESGYRYHPIDAFHPLFIQASLGLMRFNAVDDYEGLRHSYYPYDNLVVGCAVPIENTGIMVMPKAGFKTILMNSIPSVDKLIGNNQFEFGVNLGYTL